AVRRIRYPGRDTVATTRWSHTDLETGPPLQLADFHVAYPSLTLRFEPVNEETGPARYRVFERRAAALMAALRVSGTSERLPVDDDLKTDEADRASAEPGDGGIPQRVERQESCETAARDKGISPVSMPLMTVH